MIIIIKTVYKLIVVSLYALHLGLLVLSEVEGVPDLCNQSIDKLRINISKIMSLSNYIRVSLGRVKASVDPSRSL